MSCFTTPCTRCFKKNCYSCSYFYLQERCKSLNEDLKFSKLDREKMFLRVKLSDLINSLSLNVEITFILKTDDKIIIENKFKNKNEFTLDWLLVPKMNYYGFFKIF